MPTTGSKPKAKATHGRVISSDVGDWSGRDVGPILLELDNKERMELRYDSSSQGPVPEIGDTVRVQYTGESIFHISSIERIDDGTGTRSRLRELPPSQHDLVIAKPPAAVVMSTALIITGIMEIIHGITGDFHSMYAYNTFLAFSLLGIFQIGLGTCLFMYSDK